MFEKSAILAFHQTSNHFLPGINNIRPRHFYGIFKLLKSWRVPIFSGTESSLSNTEDKPVVTFTFDDGYQDNYEVLRQLIEWKCTPLVFIPSDFIGKKNSWEYSSRLFPARHLDKIQIRELAEAGVIIGSHGAGHRCLTIMDDDKLESDLSQSKKTLEDITGQDIGYLSFPFGRTNNRVNRKALECGYKLAFGLGAVSSYMNENNFVLPRMPIYSLDNHYSIKAKLGRDISRLESLKTAIINRLAGGTIIVSPGLK